MPHQVTTSSAPTQDGPEGHQAGQAAEGGLGAAGSTMYTAAGLGPLWLAWVPAGLVMLSFGETAPPVAVRARWAPEVDGELPERPLPGLVRDALDGYFAGEAVDPAALPVRLLGTPFQRRAWTALRQVRRGDVRTYAGLAQDVRSERATRAIGMAMGANPLAIVVPCHRIVAARLALGGYSGGLDRKRFLLALEGVKVEGDRVRPGQRSLF